MDPPSECTQEFSRGVWSAQFEIIRHILVNHPAGGKTGGIFKSSLLKNRFFSRILIQEAKDRALEELDMGRSATDNLGLIAFKDHWGAIGTPLTYWRYPPPRPYVPRPAWQKSLARRLVQSAPDFALEAVGTLLYRHIG